jgi:hypothetical protein
VTPQTTSPAVTTPAEEASYKESAGVVTIEQLVIGRINAPNFPIGTVVTFSGTIEQLLHYSSGQVSGLILKDLNSSAGHMRAPICPPAECGPEAIPGDAENLTAHRSSQPTVVTSTPPSPQLRLHCPSTSFI